MKIVIALLVVLACSGCATRGTYRDQVMRWGPECMTPAGFADENLKCKKHSIEHHKLEAVAGKPAADYTLGVVEFDDQGWFHHARQMEVLMDELRKEGADRELVVSVFVHGWKHNAEYCDGNIACFRTLLGSLARSEVASPGGSDGRPRRVFGIYVGWRGLSVLGPDLIRSTSFWDRKEVATQVAIGSSRELLARVRDFHETRNEKPGARNRLFITGHSFGGLVVYTSVSQYLMNSTIVNEPPKEKERVVKGFGDLVVLINPAFEAARYEPLHHIAQTRDYPPDQDPVFIAITSKDDEATGKLFPIGRRMSTLLETYSASPEKIAATPGKDQVHTREQEREANLNVAGHLGHYVTHYLEPSAGALLADVPGGSESVDCLCPYETRVLFGEVDTREESRRYREFTDTMMPDGHRIRGWERHFAGGMTLRHVTKDPAKTDPREMESKADNPFWVVQTDRPFIVGHNDFWTPHLLGFLRQVYDDILRERTPAKNLEQRARPTAPK